MDGSFHQRSPKVIISSFMTLGNLGAPQYREVEEEEKVISTTVRNESKVVDGKWQRALTSW